MENETGGALLEAQDIFVEYNRFRALHGVSIVCRERQIAALLGPNGAGKSTLLKAAFGLTPISKGAVRWQGRNIDPSPKNLVRSGLCFVPQGKSVFQTLSVKDNLETAIHFLKNAKDVRARMEEVMALFPMLAEKWNRSAGQLSGGQQQMVVLARGLMTRPQMMLLDEPSLGLSPRLVRDLFTRIAEINKTLGTAFLIVEHNLKSLLDSVHYAYVLKQGRLVSQGAPSEPALRETIHNIFKL